MTLTESLEYWSSQKGFKSLNALSVQSGVPYATLRDITKGTTENTRLSTLKALARTFGITLDELVDGPKEKAPAQNEQELSEKDQQIMRLLPFVPDQVKDGVLQILVATVDLTAAAESANQNIALVNERRDQADSDDMQELRNG